MRISRVSSHRAQSCVPCSHLMDSLLYSESSAVNLLPTQSVAARRASALLCAVLTLLLCYCFKSPPKKEFMWVTSPQTQVSLRDRLATLYNKTATVHTGERVEVLEKQKRFLRVRTDAGQEGWIESRYLVGADVFEGFQKLATAVAALPIQGHAIARNMLNLHLTPSREGDLLYQLKEGERVDIFRRGMGGRVQTAVRKAAPNTPSSAGKRKRSAASAAATAEDSGIVLEDWWLVRDAQGHAGWALGRALDLDVPLEVAQYAEGQRIVGCFALNAVSDGNKKVPQYLTLVTEPHDGLPYDFDQLRVFTWNLKRHRYETAYREHHLFGMLPVAVATRAFDKEGTLPVFTVHVRNAAGVSEERTYKLNGPIVRRVFTQGEQSAPSAPTRRSRRRR